MFIVLNKPLLVFHHYYNDMLNTKYIVNFITPKNIYIRGK